MRKQQRPPAPTQFVENSEKWKSQWLKLRELNRSGFAWYTVDGKTARHWALPILHEMTQGHCSFCDAFPLEDRSKVPVEHFRPKGLDEFAHLAFEWSNLYYCCEYCQPEKKEKWEEALIAPDESDYQFLRYFVFDYTNGAISPNPTSSLHEQERAAITIRLYGLDSVIRRQHRLLELRKFLGTTSSAIDDWAYRDFLELTM
jgi:uncharacterized protein (TIGR02646 family)